MRNYISAGDHVEVLAPKALASGDFVAVGALTGVAQGDAGAGDAVVLVRKGVFDVPKAADQAWAVGDKLYWDETTQCATTTLADGTPLIGVALATAVGSALVGRVLLDGVIR